MTHRQALLLRNAYDFGDSQQRNGSKLARAFHALVHPSDVYPRVLCTDAIYSRGHYNFAEDAADGALRLLHNRRRRRRAVSSWTTPYHYQHHHQNSPLRTSLGPGAFRLAAAAAVALPLRISGVSGGSIVRRDENEGSKP
eukprot:scaffold3038_cov250-Pinguiococcus_pyrenoidosus.AAC.3